MNKTISQNYIGRSEQTNFYASTHFEIHVQTSRSNFNSESVIGNLLHNFTKLYNERQILPKWVVIVLENDIIRNLKYKYAVERAYEPVLKWICQQLHITREKIRAELPFKMKKFGWPHFLWIQPTQHKNYNDLTLRKSFIDQLWKVNISYDDMIIMPLEQKWSDKDDNLFLEREKRFSTEGIKSYWEAVDNAIMYADSKVLRNHGKNLTEIFKQNKLPESPKKEEQTQAQSKYGQQYQSSERAFKTNTRLNHRDGRNNYLQNNTTWRNYSSYRGRQDYTRNNRERDYRPSFKYDPTGYRLPPPDRY